MGFLQGSFLSSGDKISSSTLDYQKHRSRVFAKEWCFSSFFKKTGFDDESCDQVVFLGAGCVAKESPHMTRIQSQRFFRWEQGKKGTRREHSLLKSWQGQSL
jgi:hypothetical protein